MLFTEKYRKTLGKPMKINRNLSKTKENQRKSMLFTEKYIKTLGKQIKTNNVIEKTNKHAEITKKTKKNNIPEENSGRAPPPSPQTS